MSWYYKDVEVTELPDKCVGYVYLITCIPTGRKYIGIELKDSYYKQMCLNVKDAVKRFRDQNEVKTLFDAD